MRGLVQSWQFFGKLLFLEQRLDRSFLLSKAVSRFNFLTRLVYDFPLFDLQSSKKAYVKSQVLHIFRNNFFDFINDIFKYNLASLLLHLGNFGNCGWVELDGWERHVNLVLHLQTVFNKDFLGEGHHVLPGVVVRYQLNR